MRVQAFQNELGGGHLLLRAFFLRYPERTEFLHQALNFFQVLQRFDSGHGIGQLNLAAQVEPLHDLLHVGAGEVFVVGLGDGGADQFTADEVSALHLSFVFQFKFAGDGGQRRVYVADAGHDKFFVVAERPALGVGDDIFHRGNRQALADTRALVNFLILAGGKGDGELPGAVTLARDKAGNFYGTTQSGGSYGYGTVFRLSPDGSETVLYAFTGQSDGGSPYAGVIVDAAGNLYGTTPYDGDLNCDYGQGCGTVFKVAPDGTETTLYTFADTGGNASPMAPLVMDGAGNLYGTTYGFSLGAVFKLSPDGTEKLLYSFTGGNDGGEPLGGLIMDRKGRLYGTTQIGGGGNCNNGFGCGAVFELGK